MKKAKRFSKINKKFLFGNKKEKELIQLIAKLLEARKVFPKSLIKKLIALILFLLNHLDNIDDLYVILKNHISNKDEQHK